MTQEARGPSFRPLIDATPTTPRTIDLYGRTLDGHPALWKRAVQVVPVTTFERDGRWIKSGHYVINLAGNATVAYCGNGGDESVSVQFVHDEMARYVLPRGMIETALLGKVVVSEEQQAAVFEGRRLSDFFCNSEPTGFTRAAIANERRARRKPNACE